MASASTLSVVLPNYNHAQLLTRAIDALLAQERQPDEIVIVDDGSTDNSRDVIEEAAARTGTIRVICNEVNRGAIPTLKRGLDAARGRYVYLAAADDWVMPGFFALALHALESNPTLGLFCGEAVLVDGDTDQPLAVRPAVRPVHRPRAIDPSETRRLLRRSDNWILTGSSIFRRDCVVQCGGLDEALGSFADGFLARKIALTYGFYYAPRVVAAWAIYPGSYSRNTSLDAQQARSFVDLIPARLSADPAFPAWYPAVFEKRWRFATSKLALGIASVDHSLIGAMGTRSRLDRMMLQAIWALSKGRLARVATLVWLWLRLRPTTVTGLARTALARRVMKKRDHARLAPSPRRPVSFPASVRGWHE